MQRLSYLPRTIPTGKCSPRMPLAWSSCSSCCRPPLLGSGQSSSTTSVRMPSRMPSNGYEEASSMSRELTQNRSIRGGPRLMAPPLRRTLRRQFEALILPLGHRCGLLGLLWPGYTVYTVFAPLPLPILSFLFSNATLSASCPRGSR